MSFRLRPRFLTSCFLIASLPALPALPAHAAEPPKEERKTDDRKAEAAQRFDRGLGLFNDGDNAGALAEFKRTYELFPNPVVLYNIGLVYAAMKRPVDAVDALEKVAAAPSLSAEQRTRAAEILADQRARIGRLTVTTVPEGARVEVDNVEVAKTPLTGPIRVAEGSHIVGAVAEGYTPSRKEIVIAGNSDAAVHLELVSSQGKQLANLAVRTRLPGVEVHVDGQLAGKTPLATTLTLVAGRHDVELRRPGYRTERRQVELGSGATGELAFELPVDNTQLGAEGATLALDVSEPGAVVFVDDEHKGVYSSPLRLPRGPHRLRVERGGFLPVEREVTLVPGQSNVVEVDLVPTPEMRTDYEKKANAHRTWGWIGIIGGAAIAGGGGAWLAINAGPKGDALDELNAIVAERAAEEADRQGHVGGVCDYSGTASTADACNATIDEKQVSYDDTKAKDIVGFVGIGVGSAVLVTGVILLLTGDDPDRYETPKGESLGARSTPRLGWAQGPGQVGAGLALTF